MRLFLLLSLLLASFANAQPVADPISHLVNRLQGSGGLWVNGVSPLLPYPESIKPEYLVGKILQSYDWAGDRPFRILEQREVTIDATAYQALLLETAGGQKILLLRYQPGHDWWSKLLDASDQEEGRPR